MSNDVILNIKLGAGSDAVLKHIESLGKTPTEVQLKLVNTGLQISALKKDLAKISGTPLEIKIVNTGLQIKSLKSDLASIGKTPLDIKIVNSGLKVGALKRDLADISAKGLDIKVTNSGLKISGLKKDLSDIAAKGLDIKISNSGLKISQLKADLASIASTPLNITVNPTAKSINTLRDTIKSTLAAKAIDIDNFGVTNRTVSALRRILQDGINLSPINLRYFNVSNSAISSIRNAISNGLNINIGTSGGRGSGGPGGPGQARARRVVNEAAAHLDTGLETPEQQGLIIAGQTNRAVTVLQANSTGASAAAVRNRAALNALEEGQNYEFKQALKLVAPIVNSKKTGNTAVSNIQDLNSAEGIINAYTSHPILGTLARKAVSNFELAETVPTTKYDAAVSKASQGEIQRDIQLNGRGGFNAQHPEIQRLQALAANPTTAEGINARETLGKFDRQVEEREQVIAKARRERNASFFSNASEIAEKHEVNPTLLGTPKILSAHRLKDSGAVGRIGSDAIVALANGQGFGNTLAQSAGALVGGTISPELASVGGAVGLSAALALGKVVEGLKDLAEAGFTFQRSVLGITATFLQTTDVIDKSGNPLSTIDQIAVQNKNARALQIKARSAFAEVGIGGESEASIVQSTTNAFGARGLHLSDDSLVKLSQGTGAAISILAPELASNPAVLRKDTFDIFAGLGQAGRTALGSRNPQLVRELANVEDEADAIDVFNKRLKPLIDTFKNSKDAVTQVSRFNAELDQLKTKLGVAFVDQLGPATKKLADALADPRFSIAAEQLGKSIGIIGARLIQLGADLADFISKIGGIKLPGGTTLSENVGGIVGDLLSVPQTIDAVLSYLSPSSSKEDRKSASTYLFSKDGKEESDKNSQAELDVRSKPEALISSLFNRIGGENIGISGGGEILSLPSFKELSRGSAFSNKKNISKIDEQIKLLPSDDPEASAVAKILRNRALISAQKQDQEVFNANRGVGIFGELATARNDIRVGQDESAARSANITTLKEHVENLSNEKFTVPKEIKEGQFVPTQQNFEDRQARKISSASGAIEIEELGLAKARQETARATANALAKETELDQLRSKNIDRTTFAGQLEGAKADLSNLGNEQSRLRKAANDATNPEEKASLNLRADSLEGDIAQGGAQIGLKSTEQLGQTISLLQSAEAAGHALESFPLKMEGLTLAIDKTTFAMQDLANQTELNALEGPDKAISLLKDFTSKGGSLADPKVQSLLTGAFGNDFSGERADIESEVLFGSGLNTEKRARDISKNKLTGFLASRDKGRVATETRSSEVALEQRKSDLQFQKKVAPLEFLSSQVQQATALTQLAQLTGDSKIKSAADSATKGLQGFFNKDTGAPDINAILQSQGGNFQATDISVPKGAGAADNSSKINGTISGLTEAITGLTKSVDNLNTTMKALPQQIGAIFGVP